MRFRLSIMLTFFIPLLLFHSCDNGSSTQVPAKNTNETHDDARSTDPSSEETDSDRIEESPETLSSPEGQPTTDQIQEYNGWIGEDHIPIIFRFDPDAEPPRGEYMYAKVGKMLQLEGKKLAEGETWMLREEVNGTTTGYFRFSKEDTTLRGLWSTTPDMQDSLEFRAFSLPPLSYSKAKLKAKYNGQYSEEVGTWVYELDENGETYMNEIPAANTLSIEYVGGRHFLFSVLSMGGNGHSASAEGYAVLWKPGLMVWRDGAPEAEYSSECQMDIVFDSDEISVVPITPCRNYCGARASLDCSFSR